MSVPSRKEDGIIDLITVFKSTICQDLHITYEAEWHEIKALHQKIRHFTLNHPMKIL